MLLIDADIVVMRFACKLETPFDFPDNEFTASDDPEAFIIRDTQEAEKETCQFIESLTYQLGFRKEFKLCFTGKENWRKQLFPTYKHNRKGKWIPELRNHLTDFLMSRYPSIRVAQLEADDLMGILQTEAIQRKEPSVIATLDKDLRQIPGFHYNWNKDTKPVYISQEHGEYMHRYQTLVGDPTDGYSGCPKCGPKKAKELLPDTIKGNEAEVWNIIVSTYRKHGLDEADALKNARMARILRSGEYEHKPTRRVKLWHPNPDKAEWHEF